MMTLRGGVVLNVWMLSVNLDKVKEGILEKS